MTQTNTSERPEGTVSIWLTVNGREVRLEVNRQATLAEVLRDKLNLSGVRADSRHKHKGCRGCTVLVNGNAMCSFQKAAVEVQGSEITTLEAIIIQDELEELQQQYFDFDYGISRMHH